MSEPSEIVSSKREAVAALCRKYGVRRLELFGSAARNDPASPPRDVDFLVEFGPMPSGAYADAYFGLQEELERLFDRPVELVVASAVRNPYFREALERSRVPLYAA